MVQMYPYTIAMHHYSRGIAHAILGHISEAEVEQELFRESMSHVPEDRVLHNNSCVALSLVGDAMLEGEIQYRKGDSGSRSVDCTTCFFAFIVMAIFNLTSRLDIC